MGIVVGAPSHRRRHAGGADRFVPRPPSGPSRPEGGRPASALVPRGQAYATASGAKRAETLLSSRKRSSSRHRRKAVGAIVGQDVSDSESRKILRARSATGKSTNSPLGRRTA